MHRKILQKWIKLNKQIKASYINKKLMKQAFNILIINMTGTKKAKFFVELRDKYIEQLFI